MVKFFKRIFPLKRFISRISEDDSLIMYSDSKLNTSNNDKEIIGSFSGARKVFPQSNEPIQLDDSDFNQNIDEKIDKITRAKEVEGYISRVLANFREKAVKTGFYFESQKKKI